RVSASPCALECVWLKTVALADLEGHLLDNHIVIGQVIGIHIDDRFIRDGLLDTAAMRPIARAGYHEYFVATPETRVARKRPSATNDTVTAQKSGAAE